MERMVMNRLVVIVVAAFLVTAGGFAQAVECPIVNGSFEDDGAIDDIANQDPNGWTVGPFAGKFVGYVYLDWVTNGTYNLTLNSKWVQTFAAGETATVSQQIELTDVNEITFDLLLDTYVGNAWDPNVCEPVLLIDNEVVWNPDVSSADIRGEYLAQKYVVEDKYRDSELHELSLGLMVKVDEKLYEQYLTNWDNIACNVFCNGGGLLSGDLNRDCNVDALDLQLLADAWLTPVDPQDKRNVSHVDDQQGYATIDFLDFAVYGDQWVTDYLDLKQFVEQWLEQIELGDPYNFFTEEDVPPVGVVNFFDFSAMAKNWMQSSMIPEESVEPVNE